MSSLGDLNGPLVVVGVVLLVLLVVSRIAGMAARLAIWIGERVHGPEALYEEGRAADGRLPRFGRARTDLAPRGKVFASGEVWDAVADTRIAAGGRVEVIGRGGLELQVRAAGGEDE